MSKPNEALQPTRLVDWNEIAISFPTGLGNPLPSTASATPSGDGNPQAAWYRERIHDTALRLDRIRIIRPDRQRTRNAVTMKRMKNDPDMLEEYDFSGGVRGKYAQRFAEGANLVVVDPDVAEFFPDPDSVNDALRHLAAVIRRQRKADKVRRASPRSSGR